MRKGYSRFLDFLEKIEKALLAAAVAAMIAVIVYQVVLRYIFSAANVWSEELARYLFIFEVMLGAAIAIRRNSHLQIDVVVSHLKPRVRIVFTIVTTAAGMVFLCFLLMDSVALVRTGASNLSAGLGIPMSIPYTCVPIGVVLMLLTSAEVLAEGIEELRGKGEPET
jgi:TRAP-type C4-dicarboxylate transport system permease small subunit